MAQYGIEIRTGRGHPIHVSYPRAGLDNPRMHERGGHHAKVMFGESTRLAFVGSTNFTQSSQCNIELNVRVALTDAGLRDLQRWFDERWEAATTHVISGGSSGSRSYPSRSPQRARSRGASHWQNRQQ